MSSTSLWSASESWIIIGYNIWHQEWILMPGNIYKTLIHVSQINFTVIKLLSLDIKDLNLITPFDPLVQSHMERFVVTQWWKGYSQGPFRSRQVYIFIPTFIFSSILSIEWKSPLYTHRVHFKVDKFATSEGYHNLTLIDGTLDDVTFARSLPLVDTLICTYMTNTVGVDLHECIVSELWTGYGRRGTQETAVRHFLNGLTNRQYKCGVHEGHNDVGVILVYK